ncbi:MAG: GIY-YIG nuclease family protein [Candidatus Beckwithbacteria bacterium]|nr:GIY-YIG nuclease family protein [Patescibacteria group bacterium]
MYFVYILMSLKDEQFYIGITEDVKMRFKNHIDGRVVSTRSRRPLKLIGYEFYWYKKEAGLREKYLKSSDGRKEIRLRYKQTISKLRIDEKS